MKQKAICCKAICFCLCFVLIIVGMPITSVAQESVSINTAMDNSDPIVIDPIIPADKFESVTLDELKSKAPDEKSFFELKKMSVDVSSLPSFIDSEKALQKGHVNRLKSSEKSLNTVVYQNNDGTETTYIFMRPVKYIDESGKVQDKSDKISSIADATYSYAVLNNNVKIYFPKKSNAGTKIEHKNYMIQMIPDTTQVTAPTYLDDNTIVYNGAFGENTLLKYQTKLNGIKEDIILVKNTNLNVFNFILTLNGLYPEQIDNIWYLKNSANEIVASFGQIQINDSAGNSIEGAMTITPSASRSTYNVTITVPLEFLSANSTVYPVYIDPTTTIWEEGAYECFDSEWGMYFEYYDAIQDTGLYSSSSAVTLAEGTPNYHKLGYYSSANGKIIYKLYDFYGEHGQYKTLKADQIGNVFLYITVGSGTSTTLTAYPMSSTWDTTISGENPIAINNSTLWSAYAENGASSLYLDTTSGERAINITDIVRGWADYNNGESTAAYNNPQNGFVLSSTLTASYRNITATEESSTSSVYIVMDTSPTGGDYYINNVLTGQFLKRYSSTAVTTSKYSTSNNLKWRFEYLGNDKYYIRSVYNPNYALQGSGSSLNLSYLPTNPTDKYIWKVSSSEIGGVIIKNEYSGLVLKYDKEADEDNDSTTIPLSLVAAMNSSDENYAKTVWGIIDTNAYVNLSSFTVTYPEWMSRGSVQNCQLSVNPTNATWKSKSNFYWKSSDPSVATVDTSGRVTAVDDGYTNIVVTHKPTGISQMIPITVGQMIPSGIYQIKNIESGSYIEVEGPSTAEGANIEQWSYRTATCAKWNISYYGSGYYYIKSLYSNKYMAVKDGSTLTGAAIIQTATLSDACRWKITITQEGNYLFTAKSSESNSTVLALPYITDTNGINLIQRTYTANTVYTDEWFLLYDAALLARIDQDEAERNLFIENSLDVLDNVSYFSTCLDIYSSEFKVSEMEAIMSTSKMFAIHTHGNVNSFKIGDHTYYYVSDIMNSDLSNLRLVMFLTCSGGSGEYNHNNVTTGSPANLVEACIYSGATTAVAFNQTTYVGACNLWFSNLLELMRSRNLTLQQAIDELDDPAISYGSVNFNQTYQMSEIDVIGGDSSITLNEIFS